MVGVTADYRFDGPNGEVGLADLPTMPYPDEDPDA
jgi:hypothetical protein